MNSKTCIVAMLLLILQSGLHAQSASVNESTNQLHIGSTLPAVSAQLLNSNKPVTLSQYKNKLIILDFFSIICGACIGSLPHLNGLQQQNANDLQIVLVTDEPESTVKTFFATNRLGKQNKLPVIINDKKLKKLFPHILLPHEVWIDKKGVVKAITASEALTQENITAIINDQNINLPLKEDLLNFDAAKPLFDSGNGGSADKIFFRSTFSQAISGVKSKTAVYTNGTTKRFLCLNQSLSGLYQEALNGFASNKMLWQLQNPQQVNISYCYELVIPAAMSIDAVHQMLLQDITRNFNIQGAYQQQLMPCYKLVSSSTTLLPKEDTAKQLAFVEDSISFLQPCTTTDIVSALNDAAKNASTIFIPGDDISLPAGISIDLTAVHTTPDLERQLSRYGIGIRYTQQMMNMFIITNTKAPATIVEKK